MAIYQTKGRVQYSSATDDYLRVSVAVDPGLVKYYADKAAKNLELSKSNAIVVVNVHKTSPIDLENWYLWENDIMEFSYNSDVCHSDKYYWLEIFSKDFGDIREELGLPKIKNRRVCFYLSLGKIPDKKESAESFNRRVINSMQDETKRLNQQAEQQKLITQQIVKGGVLLDDYHSPTSIIQKHQEMLDEYDKRYLC